MTHEGGKETREPFRLVPVEVGVQERRGKPGPQPGSRYTEEERGRMAAFFILLDKIDRTHARKERKAA
jgi:hypothetical protein